jgi:hypothetical protein
VGKKIARLDRGRTAWRAKRGKYSIPDNFTQRICRSVTLTAYSIAYIFEIVKGFWMNFEEILMGWTEGVDKWGNLW